MLRSRSEKCDRSGDFSRVAGTNLNRSILSLLGEDRGAALLEFAISLPLLVLFVVGIYDFSGALNQKQKMEQAAQEAAIIAAAQPMSDIQSGNASMTSLQAVANAVYYSLTASGVLPNGSCPPPFTATPGAGLTWVYTTPACDSAGDQLIITINRGTLSGTGSPPLAVETMVKVQYPCQWRFNTGVQFLVPVLLTESATVQNQI